MDLNDNPGSVTDLLGGGDPAAGDPPAGDPPAGDPPAGDPPAGETDQAFLAGFSADVGEGESASLQDWVKASGVKDVNALAKIARDNQKALRESGRVKVPGEGATAEEITAYHAAIGVPEDVKGYTVPEVRGADGSAVPLNTPFVERVLASALKHGAPKAAIDGILADEIAAQVAEHDALLKTQETAANDHVKSWGADKDAKLAAVNAAAKDAGLTRADMQFLRAMPSGPAKMLDMLAKFGSSFSEDSLIRGDRQQFGLNAAEAQKDLDAMKADPELARKAKVPGSAENARWNRNMEAVKRAAATQTVEN